MELTKNDILIVSALCFFALLFAYLTGSILYQKGYSDGEMHTIDATAAVCGFVGIDFKSCSPAISDKVDCQTYIGDTKNLIGCSDGINRTCNITWNNIAIQGWLKNISN